MPTRFVRAVLICTIAALASVASAAPSAAQDTDGAVPFERTLFNAAIGPILSTTPDMGTGAHAALGVTRFNEGGWLGLRFEAMAGTVKWRSGFATHAGSAYLDHDYDGVAGASLAVVLRRPTGTFRPYVFAGLAGTYVDRWTRHTSWQDDIGFTYGFGLATAGPGPRLYAEIAPRILQNLLDGPGYARTFLPISIGIEF